MILKVIITAVILIAIIVLLEIIRETHSFKITDYEIVSSKLPKGMKEKTIVLLSDLHNCVYGKENSRLLKAIEDQDPDLILSAGDMLIGEKGVSFQIAADFMEKVSKIAPVYYGNGNHEQRMKDWTGEYKNEYKKYSSRLKEKGIRVLENETDSLFWENRKIDISAVEIPSSYYKRFVRKELELEELEERVGSKDENAYTILIAHNPVHAKCYARWGADLVVSGHLHGGVVRIPFSRGVITPQAILFPKYSGGVYRIEDTTMVVSRGLGTHTIKVRLFNQCELVVLHMKGKE